MHCTPLNCTLSANGLLGVQMYSSAVEVYDVHSIAYSNFDLASHRPQSCMLRLLFVALPAKVPVSCSFLLRCRALLVAIAIKLSKEYV